MDPNIRFISMNFHHLLDLDFTILHSLAGFALILHFFFFFFFFLIFGLASLAALSGKVDSKQLMLPSVEENSLIPCQSF